MNKRGQFLYKRGQFYLIAGVILAGIILGFVVISNYAQKETSVRVEDIGKELRIESQKVLDYETVSGDVVLGTFGEDYSSHIGKDVEIYFISGKDPQIKAYQYVNGVETLMGNPEVTDGKIIFTLNEIDYEFDLISGENFYFIVFQEIKGEAYVFTG